MSRRESVGIFVRGASGTRIGHISERLFPHGEFLMTALDRPKLRLGQNFLLGDRLQGAMLDSVNWPRAIDWFTERSPAYERALKALQRRRTET